MTIHTASGKDAKQTLVAMENLSFDTSYEVLSRIPLTLNPVSGNLERPTGIQGNASITLAYDVDGNIETLTKTISGTSYEKTFTWTDGSLTGISTWSEA